MWFIAKGRSEASPRVVTPHIMAMDPHSRPGSGGGVQCDGIGK